jgi:hypothetical protein
MLSILASLGWIAFDVAICLRTAFMTKPMTWLEINIWGVVGLALGVAALGAAWHERETRHTDELKYERDRSDLRAQIERSSGYNEGAFVRIGNTLDQIAARSTPQVRGEVIRLKEEIQPRVELEFVNAEPCVVTSPTNIGRDQIFVRMMVKHVSGAPRCAGHLLGLYRTFKYGWQPLFQESVNLPWNYTDSLTVDIEPGIARLLNVFALDLGSIVPAVVRGVPLRLAEQLRQDGLYRFEVSVTHASKPISIQFAVSAGATLQSTISQVTP